MPYIRPMCDAAITGRRKKPNFAPNATSSKLKQPSPRKCNSYYLYMLDAKPISANR